MAILTKNALSASNQASFPNNTTGAITPQILRDFNQDVIDTLVDSLNTGSYAITTGSNDFTQPNNFTSISASSFVSASEFVGDGSKLTNITASVAIPISDEGILQGYATQLNFSGSNISASLQAGIATISVNTNNLVTTSSFNSFSQSVDGRLDSLEAATSSYANSASVAAVDAAQQSQINSLIAATSSLALTSLNAFTASQETKDATLGLYTASVDEKFTNIGGQSGSWDNTSLNSFTASQNTKNSTLASYTGSNDTKWSNLGSQSGSWITESETGSFAKLASSNTFTANNTFTAGTNVEFDGNVYIGQNQNIINGNASNLTISATAANGLFLTSPTSNITLNALGQIIVKSQISSSQAITASYFVGDGSQLTNLPAAVPLTSLNAFTASQDTKNATLANVTASLNASTASQQSQIDNLIAATGSYITTPLTSLNSFTASQDTKNSTLATYTASVDTKFSTLGTQSGSWITESETASFARTNVDNNFTANQTFTNITAVSASFQYVQTTYETSSVIYSSGSNQFGDELSDIQTLSGSVKVQGSLTVNGTPVQTSSVDITSLNAFTASQETKNSTLATYTASVDSSLTNINSFTASNGNTSLNAYTQSNDTKWSNLAGQTGSYVTSAITASSLVTASVNLNTITFTKGDASTFNITVDTGSAVTTDLTSLNAFTASQETKDTTLASVTSSLNSATASLFTSTSLSLVTASAVGNTITFTKGDTSTFSVSVSSTPIDTGSLLTTASFNAYTSSNDQRVSSLETNSASVNISISNINTATASLFTSTSLALVTASFAGNTLTFTKGDTSTFGVVIPDISGSAGNTVIETVYTGESITKGDPLYVSGSQGANPIVYKADASDPNKMPVTFVSNETIGASNTTEAIVLGLIEGIDLTGYTAGQAIYVAEGGGWSTSLPSGSNSVTQLLGVVTKGGSGGKGLVLNPGPAQLPGLDTGYLWVGGSTNQPVQITSASFATTGSNTFVGNQILTGSLIISSSATVDLQVTGAIGASGNIISSGSNGQVSVSNLAVTITSNAQTSSATYGRNVMTQASGSTRIGMSANPEQGSYVIGLAKPSIFVSSGSISVNYAPIQFERADAYTDGRVTFSTPVVLQQALTGSLTQGYVWAGGAGNITTLVATSSFISTPTDLSSLNAFTASQDTKNSTLATYTASVDSSLSNINTFTQSIIGTNAWTASIDTKFATLGGLTGSYATTGSNSFIGSQSISGSLSLTGSAYGNVVSMSVNSNTASMDFSLGNYFELSASVSPIRIEVSNLRGGVTSTLALNGVTSSAITWSSNVLQPSGSAYTSSVSGSNDILSFVAFNSGKVNVVSTLKMI